MVHKLIQLSLDNPLVVILLVLALVAVGGFSFLNINVEAYPDPAPPIIEVVAQYPGASAQEVERQVTIPLEVTLAGMPGLQVTRSKSLFGLSHLRNQFHYGISYKDAKQEVINRLQFVTNLPPNVTPQISPETPTGEIYRYTLISPKNALGQDIYTLNDLKALQDWLLQREFKRVERIIDVTGVGGTVKRYEVHPDPERLRRYGITLQQLQNTIAGSNANVGGDYLKQGPIVQVVRNVGVIGSGKDPMEIAVAMKTPEEAAAFLRAEDKRRIREIRELVITTINHVPILVNDVVQGGPLPLQYTKTKQADEPGQPDRASRPFKYDWEKEYYQDYDLSQLGYEGVVVGYQTRLGQISMIRPQDKEGKSWLFEPEKVMGIVLMHKDKDSGPAIIDTKKKAEELNQPGRLLPGVKLEAYYDRSELTSITTDTVRHNLLIGIGLVVIILLMFLHNVRSALIVAINVPLALLFAFAVLYLRGKSANLLSIGAVDFGIIVDSSVIMVENIYRHLSAGENAELPLKERILKACREVEHSLLFSTLIMVCAFLPLFTMQGPEGQIFGPMAETYAFALGGALLLALTIAPVLCLFFFRSLKPVPDNFLVRWLKRSYLRQLHICLRHRGVTLGVFGALIAGTLLLLVPLLGREFMPQLEEGNLWLRGVFPPNASLEEVVKKRSQAEIILTHFPEIKLVMSEVGRPDDGTDPTSFNTLQMFIDLKPKHEWPIPEGQAHRRSKDELIEAIHRELKSELIGVDWNFSQYIRDNVMEFLSGVQGDNSVKIFGPDLSRLEELAEKVQDRLGNVRGIEDRTGIFRIMGQTNLEFRVDRDKCKRWGVSVSDVNNVINSAVRGQAFTQMIEGEKFFDITLRWPENRRGDLSAILDIPVDITNNAVTAGSAPGQAQTPFTGPSTGPVTSGMAVPYPVLGGNQSNSAYINPLPRVPLRELLTPLGANDLPDPGGQFVRPGVAIIYREQGKRFIPVKFSVQGRDLGSAVNEAQQKTRDLFQPPSPYRAEWSGEFEEMEAAEMRLLIIVPAALGLIFLLLYMAFHSFLDAVVILSNVLALSLGGIWALLLTGENFSISAAVGFISLFGVAIMDGLLLISYFNQLRLEGVPVQEAIMQGAEKRVRPIMMTALTAVFGLLPAAVSTEIGAQTQRPLAIVVVGGMLTTLFLTRYLMPVLYSYYGHRAREKPQEEWAVALPAGTEPLANVSPEEIFGTLKYLHLHGRGEDIIRIAHNTGQNFAHAMTLVKTAEMLGFLKSSQQMAILTPAGKQLVEAEPEARKKLWREHLLKLPLFKEVFAVIQRQPDHAVAKDFVLETIVLRMPYENFERIFDTFIAWARYGDLFVYDEETETISCV